MVFRKCKDCTERRFNCHSYCEPYLAYKEKMKKVYELRRLNFDADIGPEIYLKSRDRRCERR